MAYVVGTGAQMEIGPAENWEGMPGVVEVTGPTIRSAPIDLSLGMALFLLVALAVIVFGLIALHRFLPRMREWLAWEAAAETSEPTGASASASVAPVDAGASAKPAQQSVATIPEALVGPAGRNASSNVAATTGHRAPPVLAARPSSSQLQADHDRQVTVWILSIAGTQVAIYVLLLLFPLVDYQTLKQSWFGLLSPSILSGAAASNIEAITRRYGATAGNGFAVAQSILAVLAIPLTIGFVRFGERSARFRMLRLEGAFLLVPIGLVMLGWHFLMPDIVGSGRGSGLVILLYPVTALLGSLATGFAMGQLIARHRIDTGQIRE